jgi:exopolysaccharide production protein ExoZ
MSRIVSLQILRGFAATSVVGFHLNAAAIAEGFDPGLFRYFAGGEIGVDIFFVISGFIIYYISQRRPGMTRKAFLQARFGGFYPLIGRF